MIEIIEHGKEKFEITCSRCGCKFTYQLEDLDKPYGGSEFINCPDCKERLYHKNQDTIIHNNPNHPLYAGIALLNNDMKQVQDQGSTSV